MTILNILIIFTLLQLVVIKLLKIKPTTLNCGLFAWNGDDHSKFNWTKFNLLGLMNDNRGGDSCGRSYLGDRLIGIGLNKKYVDLVKKYRNPKMVANSIFGHTRKASVGTISEITAQPIIINDDNDNIAFHLIHNGTLINYRDLAIQHEVIPGIKTDSQILAEIIYKDGFDVLAEYNGAAALVFGYNDDPNTIYAWKGASKNIKDGQTESEERPLFYFKDQDGSIYISSTQDSLEFIDGESGGDDPNLFTFAENTLYTITNGVIVDTFEVDRSNNYQKEAPYINYGGEYGYNYSKAKSTSNIEFHINDLVSNIENKIYYSKGRYWVGNEFANGIYYINRVGYTLRQRPVEHFDNYVLFYFIRGVMLKNHDSFKEMSKTILPANRDSNNRIIESMHEVAISLLRHSCYPIQEWTKTKADAVTGYLRGASSISKNSSLAQGWFTGVYSPLFCVHSFKVVTGDVVLKSDTGYLEPRIEAVITLPATILKGSEDKGVINAQTPLINNDYEDYIDSTIVCNELKRILNDIDEILMEAKNRVSIIGPTSESELVLSGLEIIQESLGELAENVD
jgi:hypothetical protein